MDTYSCNSSFKTLVNLDFVPGRKKSPAKLPSWSSFRLHLKTMSSLISRQVKNNIHSDCRRLFVRKLAIGYCSDVLHEIFL